MLFLFLFILPLLLSSSTVNSPDAADLPGSTAGASAEQAAPPAGQQTPAAEQAAPPVGQQTPGALDEFFVYLSKCPAAVLEAARAHAAKEMPGLLYVMQTAEDKAEELRLERAFLDAKKAAAEADAVRAAEQSLRTTQKVCELTKGYGDIGDRSEQLGNAIEHLRSCTLKVKEADAALRAAQRRHKANRFAAVTGKHKVPEGSALQFFCYDIRSDRGIVAEVVKACGGAIEFASDSLRDDIDIAVDAVTNDPASARFLGPVALKDFRVARAALRLAHPGRHGGNVRRNSTTKAIGLGHPGPHGGAAEHHSTTQSQSSSRTLGPSEVPPGQPDMEPGMTQSLTQALGAVMPDSPGASAASAHGGAGSAAAAAPPAKRRKASTTPTPVAAPPAAQSSVDVVALSQPAVGTEPRKYVGRKDRLERQHDALSRLRGALSATERVLIRDVFNNWLTDAERTCFGDMSLFCKILSAKKIEFDVTSNTTKDRADQKYVKLKLAAAGAITQA